eukprot:GDKI01014595.1.p1 GENE.GDKI01014595.1~~GDKI01014595.1.p1  ORF type:complete len:179 (-),score=35.04 GDKI01014595.1:437-973(-)
MPAGAGPTLRGGEGVDSRRVAYRLEGKYTKWNNNNGQVAQHTSSHARGALCAIAEEEEESESEKPGTRSELPVGCGLATGSLVISGTTCAMDTQVVPQCFSHFTWSVSDGKELVCDIQGVWNRTDGFVLTDPAIHSASSKGKNGHTDKGLGGIKAFFATHECSPLCKALGLKQFNGQH